MPGASPRGASNSGARCRRGCVRPSSSWNPARRPTNGLRWQRRGARSRPNSSFISTRAILRDPGARSINEALDALDAALAPRALDLAKGRQTLGGAVYDCKIIGVPVRDTGDLDGDGLAVVSVRLIAP